MLRIASIVFLSALISGCFMPDAIVKSGELAGSLMGESLISEARLDLDEASIHYVVRASDSRNLVVFVHGTPGDWKVFSPQLESDLLARNATLVALDRPGWGQSFIDDASLEPSLATQAQLIGPALRSLKAEYLADNLVIVGHSLGGSLVPRIAMDFPEIVDAVVVMAGDLTDDYPAARWYNHLASSLLVRWMVRGDMGKANDEVMALKSDLANMKDRWQEIQAPILVIQGVNDGLVDPRHADFAETVKTGNRVKVVRFDDGDHLLHLDHPQRVNQLISDVVLREENAFF